ncbi:MAG TPA: hypothetical protein VG892_14045 [Terriglobales bacterium]|nr:hypothetical protein [Terriglobales bacterium]
MSRPSSDFPELVQPRTSRLSIDRPSASSLLQRGAPDAKPAVRLSLESPARLLLFAVFILVASLAYLKVCWTQYRAFRFSQTVSHQNLQKAVDLDPGNDTYHAQLGRFAFYGEQDSALALRELSTAVRLNPHDSFDWLDLANAQMFAGDRAASIATVHRAVEANPRTPRLLWGAASLLLVLEQTAESMRLIHQVILDRPDMMVTIFPLLVRIGLDEKTLFEQALPPRPDVYAAWITFSAGQKRNEAADAGWSRLISLQKPLDVKLVQPYLESLISRHDGNALRNAWEEIIRLTPKLKPYLPTNGNLMVNPGFEAPLLDLGLAWRYRQTDNVQVELSSESHTGAHSLAFLFNDKPVNDLGVYQMLPVQPSTHYRLVAWALSDLQTAVAPHLGVVDTGKLDNSVTTDRVDTKAGWHPVSVEFTTGPQTSLVIVTLTREASSKLIRGRLLMDDFQVSEVH